MAHVLPHSSGHVAPTGVPMVRAQVAQHPRPHACRVHRRSALVVRSFWYSHRCEHPCGRLGWEQPATIKRVDKPEPVIRSTSEDHGPTVHAQHHGIGRNELELTVGHPGVDKSLLGDLHACIAHQRE
eukprot:scaffold135452_cov32-Tisochrysis_lutea.AAC.3